MPPKITKEFWDKMSVPEKEEWKAKQLEYEEIEFNKQARNNFATFFERTSPYKLEPWQYIVANLYTDLIINQRKGKRIKISKPPQHGGSIMTSQRLPAFAIGNNPETRVRLITYNETHSERFSKTTLGIMQSPEYKQIFTNPDLRLKDITPVNEWSTPARSRMKDSQPSYMALGLGSGFVGSGGDLVIIDDPYKTRDEAFSDTINEKIKYYHKEVLIPRLNPETNVIVMYHPWNERDYASMLDEEGGWQTIRLAAICDSENDPCGRQIGEALSPRYPIEYLEAIRDGGFYNGQKLDGIGSAAFESLYQGNPTSRDGSLVKLEWFDYVEDYQRTDNSFYVRYWDWASSEEPTADRTSGALMYRDKHGVRTVVDIAFGRFTPGNRNKFMLNTIRNDNENYPNSRVIQVIEAPNVSTEIVYGIRKFLADEGISTTPDPKQTTKESRASDLFAQMELGNVRYKKAEWNFTMQEEFTRFPNGKHDDILDSVSGANHWCTKLKII